MNRGSVENLNVANKLNKSINVVGQEETKSTFQLNKVVSAALDQMAVVAKPLEQLKDVRRPPLALALRLLKQLIQMIAARVLVLVVAHETIYYLLFGLQAARNAVCRIGESRRRRLHCRCRRTGNRGFRYRRFRRCNRWYAESGIDRIGSAWPINYTGSGLPIAVIDSCLPIADI